MAAIFKNLLQTVKTEKSGKEIKFFDLARLGDEFHKLPFSIRILLESAVRNCDNFQVRKKISHLKVYFESTRPRVNLSI